MSKFTIYYRDEFSISVMAENENEAVKLAEKASYWKRLTMLRQNDIVIQKDFYEEEADDCPDCGSKLVYIVPTVRHCKRCSYYEIDCPNCGSNLFDSYCWWCKYKEPGYVSRDELIS